MAHLPIDSHALRASSILPPGLATVHLDSFQPCPWTYFLRFAGLFGAEYSGERPRAPHPQQGFPGAILPSVPHRGGFFPGEIGNKLLFQKKFGKSRAVGCMFMQKLERTFAMKTQLPGAKARAGGGVGEIPRVWAFSGPVHFVCVLKVYAPGLQNIPKIPGKFRKINE